MKKLSYLWATLALSISALSAQTTSNLSATTELSQASTSEAVQTTGKRPMAVYAEIYGLSRSLVGFNFDTRLSKRPDGWGVRAGLSYIHLDGVTIATLPLGVNYLLGKRGKYLELGVGATPIYLSSESTPWGNYNIFDKPQDQNKDARKKSSGFTVLGGLTFGYRRQPVNGGFYFGAGLSPMFALLGGDVSFMPFIPYLSFGYSF